jgi:hypothetical protein
MNKNQIVAMTDEEAALWGETLMKIHTVADLAKFLAKVDPEEPIFMFSDPEGNRCNKILGLEFYKEGLILMPWEYWERDMGLPEESDDD